MTEYLNAQLQEGFRLLLVLKILLMHKSLCELHVCTLYIAETKRTRSISHGMHCLTKTHERRPTRIHMHTHVCATEYTG